MGSTSWPCSQATGRPGTTWKRRALLGVSVVILMVAPLAGGCTGGSGTTTSSAGTTPGDAPVGDTETLIGLTYPLDSLDEVLTTALPGATIAFDAAESDEGGGSLRITAEQPVTVALVETGDLDIDDATLFYRAKLKTQDLDGRAYLEMWCTFPDLGQYFSRGLDQPVEGTTDWVSTQTPFFVGAGQNPDNVRLNVVVEGTGTVWVDQLELYGVAAQ